MRQQQAAEESRLGRSLSNRQKSEVALRVVRGKVRSGDFKPPREIKPAVPAALEAICLRAMALSPEDRYSSPQALAESITKWLSEEPIAAWRSPVEYFDQLVRQHPQAPAYREGLALRRTNLGLVLAGVGGKVRLAEAESEFRAVIEDYQALCAANPGDVRYPAALAHVRFLLHRVLESMGRFTEAEAERMAADDAIRRLITTGSCRTANTAATWRAS